MIALIAFGWPGYARLIRGDVLAVKERDFVLTARSVGARDPLFYSGISSQMQFTLCW